MEYSFSSVERFAYFYLELGVINGGKVIQLRLLYLHDRIKQIMVQIVDNDLDNKFEMIYHSIFEYLNNKFDFPAHRK